jgi:hypothetical protein
LLFVWNAMQLRLISTVRFSHSSISDLTRLIDHFWELVEKLPQTRLKITFEWFDIQSVVLLLSKFNPHSIWGRWWKDAESGLMDLRLSSAGYLHRIGSQQSFEKIDTWNYAADIVPAHLPTKRFCYNRFILRIMLEDSIAFPAFRHWVVLCCLPAVPVYRPIDSSLYRLLVESTEKTVVFCVRVIAFEVSHIEAQLVPFPSSCSQKIQIFVSCIGNIIVITELQSSATCCHTDIVIIMSQYVTFIQF